MRSTNVRLAELAAIPDTERTYELEPLGAELGTRAPGCLDHAVAGAFASEAAVLFGCAVDHGYGNQVWVDGVAEQVVSGRAPGPRKWKTGSVGA